MACNYRVTFTEQALNLLSQYISRGLLVGDRKLQSLCFKLSGFCLKSGEQRRRWPSRKFCLYYLTMVPLPVCLPTWDYQASPKYLCPLILPSVFYVLTNTCDCLLFLFWPCWRNAIVSLYLTGVCVRVWCVYVCVFIPFCGARNRTHNFTNTKQMFYS